MPSTNSMLTASQQLQHVKLSPAETARYSRDLIESLRKIATNQGHDLLAHLLGLASAEAKALAERDYAQDTRLPE